MESTRTAAEVLTAMLEAHDRRDTFAIAALFAEDAVEEYVGVGEFTGRLAITDILQEMFDAFPDFSLEVARVVGDDSVAVAEWTVIGTFTGTRFEKIVPTGRRFSLRGCSIALVRNGEIVRATVFFDGAGIARQMGLLPQKGSFSESFVLGSMNLATRVRERLSRHP